MKSKLLQGLVAGALLAGSALAATQTNLTLTDAEIANNIQHQLMKDSNFTIFDDISFKIENGQVTLFGTVTEPYMKTDIHNVTAKAAGVQSVTDNIQVLPFSDSDNLLRTRIAGLIHNDPSLARYGTLPNPSIHILVNNGQVTLLGAVNTQSDKDEAALRASAAGRGLGSVVNNLQVVSASRT